MRNLDEIVDLAARYLAACNSVVDAAVARGDSKTAANVTKSALSVAVNCAIAFDTTPATDTALTWYERLSLLYMSDGPDDLSDALKWGSAAINELLTKQQPEHVATEE
jgi:hypothetical protein